MGPDEEVLAGGNSSTVVREGDRVHRTAGPWTPAVHELLTTLRASGIVEVPEPHGFDDQGREVLSFLPGDVGGYPLPEWLWDPALLEGTARLLRRVHDASVPLAARRDLVWGLPVHEPVDVVCHNDSAPYNMTFADGRVTGLFDWDTAAPGPRIRDLAYLAYRLAPFTDDAPHLTTTDRLERTDRLLTAYGSDAGRADLLRAMADRLDDLAAYTDERAAETGRADFVEHAAGYRRHSDHVRRLASSSSDE
ncbi:phosphotransferase [Sanguibacter suaedae]|uniref:Phosphotransferase n=1 Tax=Sanguibacter suaedae TaxID=2795737 RepID=A0A934I1S9_9MICO|nr:phosphotransferase [Sanguibacter suaedae]MBI9113613.1 phosphotransferase [Sanguibacter suaedae]